MFPVAPPSSATQQSEHSTMQPEPNATKSSEVQLDLPKAIELAWKLHQARRDEDAEHLCELIIEKWPHSAEGWNYLGTLRYQRGEERSGELAIRLAIELAPDYVAAHGNLGNVLLNEGRLSEAEHHLRRALRLNADMVGPYIALAAVLRATDRFEEGIELLRPALKKWADFGPILNANGNLLFALRRYQEAMNYFNRAITATPQIAAPIEARLAKVLCAIGKPDEAREIFRRRLETQPDDVFARHMLSSFGGAEAPPRADDRYVKRLFDDFAASFDSRLAHLRYQAPSLVADRFAERIAPQPGSLEVLDAGCGTGLLGPLLQRYCRTLDGVDLSPGMLKRAEQRKCYDRLIEAELTGFLTRITAGYDAITSADTLCYFGALEAFAAAAHNALRAGGWLLFSVEHTDDLQAGYRLERHGRYSHHAAYVEACLHGCGFRQLELAPAHLRVEDQKPVAGLIVSARKGA